MILLGTVSNYVETLFSNLIASALFYQTWFVITFIRTLMMKCICELYVICGMYVESCTILVVVNRLSRPIVVLDGLPGLYGFKYDSATACGLPLYLYSYKLVGSATDRSLAPCERLGGSSCNFAETQRLRLAHERARQTAPPSERKDGRGTGKRVGRTPDRPLAPCGGSGALPAPKIKTSDPSPLRSRGSKAGPLRVSTAVPGQQSQG